MRSDGIGFLLRPLRRAVASMIGRGLVRRVDEGASRQKIQVRILQDELRDLVDVVGHYGLAASPEPGAEAVVLFVSGNRDHGIAISIDDPRYRPTDLSPGEVRLYGKSGSAISLLPDGSIRVRPSSGVVTIDAAVTISGDLTAGGEVADGIPALAQSLSAMRDTFNLHTHAHGSGPGITAPPAQSM